MEHEQILKKNFKAMFICEKSSHSSETSHLSEISAESLISLCKSKSFIWEWIHPTQVRSHLNAGEISLRCDDFSLVNTFCQAVQPRQDCSFSSDSVCFYIYYVKKCNSSYKIWQCGCLLLIRAWNKRKK